MKEYEREYDYYRNLNRISQKGNVVLFGSSFMKSIPVSELTQTFGLNCVAYNRSFTDLSVFDAKKLLSDTITELMPGKLVLQLGETDLARGYKSLNEITEEYAKLIKYIKAENKKIKIIIASICSTDPETVKYNKMLEELANKLGCQYADITNEDETLMPEVKAFSLLKCFIIDKLNFYDIMQYSFS